jgi:hypothetical protein
MALVIEDGSGVSGSNSFVDVAYADAYFAGAGQAVWVGDDVAKEAALIRAGRYLNGLRWQGSKFDFRHSMCWPRFGVPVADMEGSISLYPSGFGYGLYWNTNEVPEPVKQAQCEAALRYLAGTEMLPDLERGGQVVMERVDVITTQYASGAPAGTRFLAVEALLRPFLKSSASVDLVRG